MIKRTIILCKILVIIFSIFVLTGCQYDPYKDKKNVVVETDYFYVQLLIKDGQKLMGPDAAPYASILELTDLGKEQEIIVIPEYLEGLPVRQIGSYSWPSTFWGFESENLKKVYVPIIVNYIEESAFTSCINLEELVVLSVPISSGGSVLLPRNGRAKLIYSDPLQENRLIAAQKSVGKTIPVNLVFYYNYIDTPNLGYYWFDFITGSNLYRLPDDPTKDDSTFKGWYIDEECSIEWDEVLPASDIEIIELYAGWE